jgi:hypothetical protein
MGSITYDFLADSILFDQDEINTSYASLTDNRLEQIVQDYRKHCIDNLESLTSEVTNNKSALKVLSSIEKMPYAMLKQSALYFDQFVIYDPLFAESHQSSDTSQVLSQYLGFEKKQFNRKKIVEAAKQLREITPMVASDFVKMLPLSYAFEPPQQQFVTLPENYYADAYPPEIMNFCRERVTVKSMQQQDGKWRFLPQHDYTPGLFIQFEELGRSEGFIYHYILQHIDKIDENNRGEGRMELAEYPMDPDVWNIWKFQSENRSAKDVVDEIKYENFIASKLKATYLTDNKFTSDLLINRLSAEETVETSSASQFLNIKLPFLDDVNIEKLMHIRANDSDTFTNFRIELERQFRELRTITDPKELKQRQENIIHELGKVQVHKITQKLDSLKKKGYAEGTMLLGGLAATVQTGGWSLLASAIAAASGYKTYREYKDSLVENPSYLLWKVLNKR